MKSRDFAQVLTQIAGLTRDPPVRLGLNELASVFDQAGTTTVAGTLKRAAPVETAGQGLSTGPLLTFMKQVQGLLALTGKPAVAKDFNEVVRVVQQYPVITFASSHAGKTTRGTPRTATKTSAALNTDLVERYESALDAALRDEAGFAAIFSRLQNDPQMRPIEMRELSRAFAGVPGKSKTESLRKIWSRHQNFLVSRAQDRATAGRSAA